MTATLTASNGMQIQLTDQQVRLLQKACHKMEENLRDFLYDLTVYYPGVKRSEQIQEEATSYKSLRTALEDLED